MAISCLAAGRLTGKSLGCEPAFAPASALYAAWQRKPAGKPAQAGLKPGCGLKSAPQCTNSRSRLESRLASKTACPTLGCHDGLRGGFLAPARPTNSFLERASSSFKTV